MLHEMREMREQADYEHDAVFTRPDALARIALARRVAGVVGSVDSVDATRFFGLIAMQARVQAR